MLRHRLGSALPEGHRDVRKSDGGALLQRGHWRGADAADSVKGEGTEKRRAFLKAAQPGGLVWDGWGGWVRVGAPSVSAILRPCNAASSQRVLRRETCVLSSDAYSLQAAPPASCSSRCGSGLCFASVASVMKELTLLQRGQRSSPSRDTHKHSAR